MSPERTASSLGQLIVQLSKSAGRKLPEPWTPADLVSLIDSYRALIKTISAKDRNKKSKANDAERLMYEGAGYERAHGMTSD